MMSTRDDAAMKIAKRICLDEDMGRAYVVDVARMISEAMREYAFGERNHCCFDIPGSERVLGVDAPCRSCEEVA